MSTLQSLRAIVGADGVLDAAAELAGYRGDLACPAGGEIVCAVRPRSTPELAQVVTLCAAERIAIVPRGGGTGLAGGATPAAAGPCIVVSFERMRAIRSLDTVGNVIVVEAGCTLQMVRDAAADAERLLALEHGGAGSSQIGGNLATNAGGNNVLRYGMAREQVLGLEVVLGDGRVLPLLAPLRKNNAGYDLKQIFLGSEGTLGLIAAAALRLRASPRFRATACIGVADPQRALDLLVAAQSELGDSISAFELMSRIGIELHFRHVAACREPFEPPTPWLVLIEADTPTPHFDLDAAMAAFVERGLQQGLALGGTMAASGDQRRALWQLREGIAVAMLATPGSLKSDQAVPLAVIPDFIAQATAAVAAIVPAAVPVPFGHLGDGNIHFNVMPPPGASTEQFIAQTPALTRAIEGVALALGGTVAAEHGIGLVKRAALARMRSPLELELMRKLKAMLDPAGILNPGKVLPD